MIERLTVEEYACSLALAASMRSEDAQTQVGCAILDKNGRILSTGFNGLKAGVSVPPWMFQEELRTEKLNYMIHAETNALSMIKRNDGHLIALTISPCVSCAHNIISHGIKRVIYLEEYHRCSKFKKIFDFNNIEYIQLAENSKNRIKKIFSGKLEKL